MLLIFCGCTCRLFSWKKHCINKRMNIFRAMKVNTLRGRLVFGQQPNWLKQLSSDLDLVQKNMQFDAERKNGETKLEHMYAKLYRIKQKCTTKGITGGTASTFQNGQSLKRVGISVQENNGVRYFLERTVNPVTGRIEEKHYSIDLSDSNAESTC